MVLFFRDFALTSLNLNVPCLVASVFLNVSGSWELLVLVSGVFPAACLLAGFLRLF